MPAEPTVCRILYVTDSDADYRMFIELMQPGAASSIEWAASEIAALDDLPTRRRAELPNLILANWLLSSITGTDFVRHLKADSTLRLIPVILLGTDLSSKQVDDAYAAGGDVRAAATVGLGGVQSRVRCDENVLGLCSAFAALRLSPGAR